MATSSPSLEHLESSFLELSTNSKRSVGLNGRFRTRVQMSEAELAKVVDAVSDGRCHDDVVGDRPHGENE